MCLIALAWRCHPRYRLALIANRDELHARPAAPAGHDPERPDIYGGRDLLKGGGWLMASTHGRLAAVTNVRVGPAGDDAPRVAPARSRGELVRGFVGARALADEWLGGLDADAGDYGPFNLIAWDGDSLAFASNHPDFDRHLVEPGLHAMSNGAFDADWPKSGHAMRALSAWLELADHRTPASQSAAAVAPEVAPLFGALADTTPAPDATLPDTGVGLALERAMSPPFVRGERYGTRCSTVVLVEDEAITFVERRFAADASVAGESIERLPIESSIDAPADTGGPPPPPPPA